MLYISIRRECIPAIQQMSDKGKAAISQHIKNGHILPTGQWYAPSAVINDALFMPEYARAFQSMPEYARVCQSMPGYARVCQSMPEYARVCQSMPEYARVCQSMPDYAR